MFILSRYEKASTRLAEVGNDIMARNAKRSQLESFLRLMDGRNQMLTEFDETLWLGIIDKVKVPSDDRLVFVMKDGREVSWVS